METRPKILIVDGHSAIFGISTLASLHKESNQAGRDHLHRLLVNYQALSSIQVILVFDGQGAYADKQRQSEQDILAIFSRKNETADSIIEGLVARYQRKCQITVATNDNAEQSLVSSLGGQVWSIQRLALELEG